MTFSRCRENLEVDAETPDVRKGRGRPAVEEGKPVVRGEAKTEFGPE